MPQRKQVGGTHYAKHKIQPWDIIDEYKLDFYEGNILKYLLRDKENRIEDLQKLIHYAEKAIEDAKLTAEFEEWWSGYKNYCDIMTQKEMAEEAWKEAGRIK